MRRADADRVCNAQMQGALAAIRDAVMLDRQDRLEQLRQSWPELAERIEAAITLVEPLGTD